MNEEAVASNAPEASVDSPNSGNSSWIGPDGKFGDMTSAPEQIRDLVGKKGYKSVEDVVSSYSELNKKFSSSYRLPDEMTPEITNDILTRLGRPESADKYAFDAGDMEYNEDMLGVFKGYAHQHGLTQSQFENLVKFDIERSRQYAETMKEESEQVLKEKYGEEYQYKVSVADKLIDKLGLTDTLKSIGLYDHAAIKEAMLKISDMTGESSIPDNKAQSAKSNADRLSELMKHPAMHNRLHPEHASVHKEWLSLQIAGG